MEADRLKVFRTVARLGSFSRAALELHRTQPAVSQAIRALEDEVGEALILRRGRRNSLTRAGEVVLRAAEDSARVLERGMAELEARRELLRGELAIGTSDTTACYLLPDLLAAFRERHPGIELRLSNRPSPVTVQQVRAREVDLGLVTLPIALPAELARIPLAEREDVAIVAPGHPLARRKRVRLVDLLDHPLLLLDRGSQTRSLIDGALRELGRPARVAMELASIEVIKRLVGLDFGVSIVPAISVQAEVATGTLVAHRVLPRSARRRLGAIHLERGPVSPAAEAFLALAGSMLR